MDELGEQSIKYVQLLEELYDCLINVLLLREEDIINKFNLIINEDINVIYRLLVATNGKHDPTSEAFEFIIQSTNFLTEKYQSKLLDINLISLAYYAMKGKVQNLEKNINEDLFTSNTSYMKIAEVFIAFIKVAGTKVKAIYEKIDNRQQSILSIIDKSINFIKKNKKEIYRQIIVREVDIQDRKKIFISYTHKDESLVLKIRNRFKLSNLKVWIDEESIKPAEQINEAIKKALDNANYFLLFDSENSRKSTYVNEEIEYTLEVYSKIKKPIIIPILISVDKTRDDIEGIKNIKGIDSNNLDICMSKIFKAIDAKIIEIKVAELNTLLMLLENFVQDILWCYTADYNMGIDEDMFINCESLEHYLNEKWLLFEGGIEYSFIREYNEGLEFNWNFYNSNRMAIIGVNKLKYILNLFNTIIRNSNDNLYSMYESIFN